MSSPVMVWPDDRAHVRVGAGAVAVKSALPAARDRPQFGPPGGRRLDDVRDAVVVLHADDVPDMHGVARGGEGHHALVERALGTMLMIEFGVTFGGVLSLLLPQPIRPATPAPTTIAHPAARLSRCLSIVRSSVVGGAGVAPLRAYSPVRGLC